MKRTRHSLSAALMLGAACAPCRAFSPAGWMIAPPPGLVAAALWLVALGWCFRALLRYHLRFDDRLGDAEAQLGIERHARMLAERALAETHKMLCRLVEQQEGVRETERRRIARDIHDDLGQNLMALKIELTTLQQSTRANPPLRAHLGLMIGNLDLAIKSLRGIINDLRPLALDGGLREAMEWQLSEFTRLNGIAHHFAADPAAFGADKSFDSMLFRILQESLSNVARHARASEVRVELTRADGRLKLMIHDNGVGISCEQAGHGCGLEGMRERVAGLGGSFTLASEPGGGCRLALCIPLPQPLVLN